jgi:hypothetical protein
VSVKIWLDDIRPCPYDDPRWSTFTNIDDAWRSIQGGIVDEISFDHDLGLPQHGVEKNGYTLAVWILEAAFIGRVKRLKWQIHSANPAGRDAIYAAMTAADHYWTEQEGREK